MPTRELTNSASRSAQPIFLFASYRRSFLHAAPVVAQRNVHEHLAAAGLDAHDQRLGILAALVALLGGVHLGRMHAEVEALVIKRGDRIPDDLVGELADSLPHQLLRRRQ